MMMDCKTYCSGLALLAMALGCNLGDKGIGSLTTSATSAGSGGTSNGTASGGSSDGADGQTSVASSSTAADTSGSATGSGTGGEYERECQPDDFVCDNFGCAKAVVEGECYKFCTPDSTPAIGEVDDECDEPQRPFCGQVGDALDGDFTCNGCHHICVGTQGINECMQGANDCG